VNSAQLFIFKNQCISVILLLVLSNTGCTVNKKPSVYIESETEVSQSESVISIQPSSPTHAPESTQAILPATHYGSSAALNDPDLTLEEMLLYALENEYLTKYEYKMTVEQFGDIRPFKNLTKAEDRHIGWLLPLFEQYKIEVQPDASQNFLKTPLNLKESLNTGIISAKATIMMYERFLSQPLPDDVHDVFKRLLNVSASPLKALQNNLSRIEKE
jgi:hypothetical protein